MKGGGALSDTLFKHQLWKTPLCVNGANDVEQKGDVNSQESTVWRIDIVPDSREGRDARVNDIQKEFWIQWGWRMF